MNKGTIHVNERETAIQRNQGLTIFQLFTICFDLTILPKFDFQILTDFPNKVKTQMKQIILNNVLQNKDISSSFPGFQYNTTFKFYIAHVSTNKVLKALSI